MWRSRGWRHRDQIDVTEKIQKESFEECSATSYEIDTLRNEDIKDLKKKTRCTVVSVLGKS